MNTTTLEPLTEDQVSTNTPIFTDPLSSDTSAIPPFAELLATYNASIDTPEIVWNRLTGDELDQPASSDGHHVPTHAVAADLALASGLASASESEHEQTHAVAADLASASGSASASGTIDQTNLANDSPQPTRWLWPQRLSLAGINLLDGDHGTGLSLFCTQLAASVSSDSPMSDGSMMIHGNVLIVSPYTDPITQCQILSAFGANLSQVEILSTIQETDPTSHTTSTRPFSIPEDLPLLFQAIKRNNTRLIIFDSFISLLSRKRRCTDKQLGHLLTDLNQQLLDHHVACIITRNCPAKGGHARPSVLERSEQFAKVAASRLLLAPDPLYPGRLLLSHAKSRYSALTPTLTFQIQPRPDNPDLPHITILGIHRVSAKDLLDKRPDVLHRQLLFDHLLHIINNALDPLHVSILYALSPHSSAFQIQRSLKDLLNMGQIERPTRGFYAPAPPIPVPSFKQPAATTRIGESTEELKQSATINQRAQSVEELKQSAATTQTGEDAEEFKQSAAITQTGEDTEELKQPAAITQTGEDTEELKQPAATTRIGENPEELKQSAATTQIGEPAEELKRTAAITQIGEPAEELKRTAAITLKSKTPKRLHQGRSKQRNTKKRR